VILSATENVPNIVSQIREIPCCDNNVQKVIVEMAADVAKWWGKKYSRRENSLFHHKKELMF
jgi:hypothetical protein